MSIDMKKIRKKKTATLYARGVFVEHIDFIKKDAEYRGFDSVGEYLNELFEEIRRNAEGDAVRKKA